MCGINNNNLCRTARETRKTLKINEKFHHAIPEFKVFPEFSLNFFNKLNFFHLKLSIFNSRTSIIQFNRWQISQFQEFPHHHFTSHQNKHKILSYSSLPLLISKIANVIFCFSLTNYKAGQQFFLLSKLLPDNVGGFWTREWTVNMICFAQLTLPSSVVNVASP